MTTFCLIITCTWRRCATMAHSKFIFWILMLFSDLICLIRLGIVRQQINPSFMTKSWVQPWRCQLCLHFWHGPRYIACQELGCQKMVAMHETLKADIKTNSFFKSFFPLTFIAVHSWAKSWQASSFSLLRLIIVSATLRITFDPS